MIRETENYTSFPEGFIHPDRAAARPRETPAATPRCPLNKGETPLKCSPGPRHLFPFLVCSQSGPIPSLSLPVGPTSLAWASTNLLLDKPWIFPFCYLLLWVFHSHSPLSFSHIEIPFIHLRPNTTPKPRSPPLSFPSSPQGKALTPWVRCSEDLGFRQDWTAWIPAMGHQKSYLPLWLSGFF